MFTRATSVAEYLLTLVKTGSTTPTVADADVYYGDQVKIPRTPTVCVEAGDTQSELNGAPRRVMKIMTSYIIVYIAKVGSTQVNQLTADSLAESIEDLVHQDAQMGDNVIDSLVTAIEYGYQQKDNSIYRAARLTVVARQQEQLP